MSDPRRTPRFALASAFTARPWSGVAVLRRAGVDMTLPTYGGEGGTGVYLDALDFLHRYSVASTLSAALAAVNVSVELGPADRLVFTNTNEDEDAVISAAAANHVFGLPAGGAVVPKNGGTYTAASDWRRGLVSLGAGTAPPSFTVSVLGVGAATAPSAPRARQDVRVMLRERGAVEDLDDAGAGGACLEEQDTNGAWAVDDDGHVVSTSTAAGGAVTWLSTSFRDRLGFTGEEVPVLLGGGVYQLRAARPLPGLIVPTRPYSSLTPVQEEEGSALKLTDGSYASSHIGSYRGGLLEWWCDGPESAGGDLSEHWLAMRAEFVRQGEPVTLYQSWGDSRRMLLPRLVTAEQPPYDTLYTSDRDGRRGRILCRLHPDGAREDRLPWEGSIHQRVRVSTRLAWREAGV